MLFTSVLLMPHIVRACFVSPRGAIVMVSLVCATWTSFTSVTLSSPRWPLAETSWPVTFTVTPSGMTIGCLPIRDMNDSFEPFGPGVA
jgi:hypothetical protein